MKSKTDIVWHYNSERVYSSPRIHKNGHQRPKAVSFNTKEIALRKFLENIRYNIFNYTRIIKNSSLKSEVKRYTLKRKQERKKEKRTLQQIKNLDN